MMKKNFDFSGYSYSQTLFCLVCGFSEQHALGKRGNREYSGADMEFTPHVQTSVVQCQKCGFIYESISGYLI
jgi:rubredoxin